MAQIVSGDPSALVKDVEKDIANAKKKGARRDRTEGEKTS